MLIDGVKIIKGNLFYRTHQEALIELTNAYLSDDMGEGRVLDGALQRRLILGLREHSGALLFFAQYREQFIGLATCFISFSTFHARKLINIHDLIVLPQHRNQGVAKKILLAVETEAKIMDCCKLTLEVRMDNIRATNLYKKLGFNPGNNPMHFWLKGL